MINSANEQAYYEIDQFETLIQFNDNHFLYKKTNY